MTGLLEKAAVQGYADRLSVAPGEAIEFKISCDAPGDYHADVVRLIHGDTSPEGPGFKDELVETEMSGDYPGRLQETDAGSCVVVRDGGRLAFTSAFTLHAFIHPTTPDKPDQVVLGRFATGTGRGYAMVIEDGSLGLHVGDGDGAVVRVSTGERLFERCWYSAAVTYDPSSGAARLFCEPVVNGV